MIEIIPAILTDSEEELVRLVHLLERAGVTRVHLDICDGQFVPTRTINGYDELRRLASSLKWDVHLMVQHPNEEVSHWQGIAIDRFIVHVETGQLPPDAWAAVNPETSLEHIPTNAPGVTFMTVHPGQQGQPFLPDVLEKMRAFHVAHPGVPLMADGGMTPTTASQCVAAGASILVSGSYLLKSGTIEQGIKELRGE